MSWLAKDLREMRFTMGNSQAISYPFMDQMSPIDKELAAAEEASWGGNQGKARVCARRAVALAERPGRRGRLLYQSAAMRWPTFEGFSRRHPFRFPFGRLLTG